MTAAWTHSGHDDDSSVDHDTKDAIHYKSGRYSFLRTWTNNGIVIW